MQLIVETETTLDIERNMSTIEDVQNSKVESLNIEENNKKKCNGKAEVIQIEDEESQEKQEIPDSPNDITQLRNVELNEMISTPNLITADDAQNRESQNDSSEKENIKENTNEKEVDKLMVLEQDDDLEDDIISFSDEPFRENREQEGVGITPEEEKDDEVIDLMEESPASAEDNANVSVKDDDGAIVDLDEIEETENDKPLCKDNQTEAIETLEKPVKSPAFLENDTDASPKVKDAVEKLLDSSIQCEEKVNSPRNEKAVVISTETDYYEKQDDSSLKVADKDSSIDDHDSINLKANDTSDVTEESKNKNADGDTPCVPEEDKMILDEDDDMNLVEEAKKILDESDSKDTLGEEQLKDKTEKITIDSENIPEKTNVNDEIELIDDDLPQITIDNDSKTDSSSTPNTTNLMDTTESAEAPPAKAINTAEADKCESTLEVSKDKAVDLPTTVGVDVMDIEDTVEECKSSNTEAIDSTIELKDDSKIEQIAEQAPSKNEVLKDKETAPVNDVPESSIIDKPIICKLSNTLDILSDDEDEEPSKVEPPNKEPSNVEPVNNDSPKVDETKNKMCISLEDDDDIMVIDEDTTKTDSISPVEPNKEETPVDKTNVNTDLETGETTEDSTEKTIQKETTPPATPTVDDNTTPSIMEKTPERKTTPENPKPLIQEYNFLKTTKKKLSDMTRHELEEFCLLKIVDSIVDRSSLSDIKVKLRTVTQSLEEHRKKALMLTKQNRDLQVVLKSVQEEQRKTVKTAPIIPLKITRSVGMQVFMEKTVPKKRFPVNNNNKNPNQQNKGTQQQIQKQQGSKGNQNIPVPRLVPANNPALKTPSTIPQVNQVNSPAKNNIPNGVKTASPAQKAEKRPHNKIASSVTVDLTDDEPPTKQPGGPRASPAPPVRLVSPQSLMAPQRQQFPTSVNSPRKVYIPISGPQNQQLRPGQTIMLKTVVPTGMRPRGPNPQMARMDGSSNGVRMNRVVGARHPAPLPLAMKQYQPPNWKSLPPAPDLKLSKVENGIVISWKIEGIPEDSYEEIASYQLYAYQETSSPPNTSLWKKIGDVKALPLPMACTLTQFMAGFKYYFAVRAVDIRSRLGPFSLPGSILLLSKNI